MNGRIRRSLAAVSVLALVVVSGAPATAATGERPTPDRSTAALGPVPEPPEPEIPIVDLQPPGPPTRLEKDRKVQPADSGLLDAAQSDPDETVVVEIHHRSGARPAVEQLVAEIGGVVNGPAGDRVLEVRVRVDRVDLLEAAAEVDYVIEPGTSAPQDTNQPGEPGLAVAGQELTLTRAASWQAAGFRGQGIKVGIIDSFSQAAWNSAVASGDLAGQPAGTFCRNLGATCPVWGSSEHGPAVAEIVHEVAPGALLYIATARSAADFQAAIDYFAAQGVTIVTRSETAEYDGPGDGTGALASVVAFAVSKGMLYLNAAGNSGGSTAAGRPGSYWRGSWADSDADGWLDFSTGDELLQTTCWYFNGLRWSDWGGDAAGRTDYDVYVYDSAGTEQLGSSVSAQQSGAPPIERLNTQAGCTVGQTVQIAVWLYDPGDGTAGDVLEFMVNGVGLEYWSNPHSAAAPMADTAVPGALAVGAIDPAAGVTIAPYSSQGPTNDDRVKPDLTAPSCVSSNSYAPDCFNGTSAATPVVAGVAALVASAGVAVGPEAIATYLRSTTVDRGAAGIDNVYGHGQLVLPAPPQGFSAGPVPAVAGSPPMTLTGYTPVAGAFHYGKPDDIYFYGAGVPEVMWAGTPAGTFLGRATRQQTSSAVPVAGDFNGDGKDDIFFYVAGSTAEQYWLGSQTGVFTPRSTQNVTGTYRPVVGDYDGDGRDDIYWYASGPGTDALWMGSATGTFVGVPARSQPGVYTPLAGDYDGDGRDDILWYAAGSTAEQLWRGAADTSFPTAAVAGVSGTYRPVAGDFNGDGRDDIFWYAPGSAAESLWRGTGAGFTAGYSFVVNGTYVPCAGAFTGDTKDDVFLYAAGSAADVLLVGR